MSVMSMMIFQSCVRYCWVMMVKSFTSRSCPFTLQLHGSGPAVSPGFHCCHGCSERWSGWDARIWVEICGAELQGWRMTWFSGSQPFMQMEVYNYVKGFFFGGEHVKIGFAFGRLWMAKRCDGAVFDQYRSSVLNCLFRQLLHLWSQASFSGWNLWSNRPFYDILTYYMFRCICLCILYMYIYTYMHIHTILCTIFTLTRIWLCMLYHISANWTNNFQTSGCLLASPYPFSKVDHHQDISWKKRWLEENSTIYCQENLFWFVIQIRLSCKFYQDVVFYSMKASYWQDLSGYASSFLFACLCFWLFACLFKFAEILLHHQKLFYYSFESDWFSFFSLLGKQNLLKQALLPYSNLWYLMPSSGLFNVSAF